MPPWLKPPPTDGSLPQRSVAIIHWAIVAGFAALMVGGGFAVVIGGIWQRYFGMAIVMGLIFAGLRAGYVYLAAVAFTILPWIAMLHFAATTEGVTNPGLHGLSVVVLVAGLVLGGRFGVGLAVASGVAVLGMYAAQISGILLVTGPASPERYVLTIVMVLVVGAVVVHTSLRQIDRTQADAEAQAARAWDAIRRRDTAEDHLRHAQRLEAIGQLAGGISHDFNNLLTAVTGNLEIVRDRVDGEDRVHVDAALRAVFRGAQLTKQLLAFSRRQPLAPRSLDVNELVTNMHRLLRRTLGEKIVVVVTTQADLWPCQVDPGQLEAALLNLALNARDAMPGGGDLSIKTANEVVVDDLQLEGNEVLPEGEYVFIEVADTGVGMPPQIREAAFEPFFTTKDKAEGTGLGLSMVYGFIKQSGGFVSLESSQGKGTTIKVWLPKTTEAAHLLESSPEVEPATGCGELILLVEDDSHVRQVSEALLGKMGYRTISAANAEEALALLDDNEPDLLFCDVVLPGQQNGPELAKEIQRRCPGIPVLLTSGYTGDARPVSEGFELLHKPFRARELKAHVNRLLHQPAEAARDASGAA